MSSASSAPPSHTWQEVEDAASRRTLYYNRETGITTFDKPDELKNMDEKKRDIYLKTGILLPDMSSNESEVVNANAAQCSSVDTSIDSSNMGFKMLQKMGWKEEKGLGKEGQGIIAPIEANAHAGNVGVGKDEEYNKALDEVTRERKKLDVEIEQTEEVAQQRKNNAERFDQIESDIRNMHKEFYCEICNKQYVNVQEMSSHLSSYDHHHKKRFKEMKETQKKRRPTDSNDERQRKEAKRAAKEFRERINAAPNPPPLETPPPPPSDNGTIDVPLPPNTITTNNESENKSKKPVKFGFSMKKVKK